jgi:hypothetical protein
MWYAPRGAAPPPRSQPLHPQAALRRTFPPDSRRAPNHSRPRFGAPAPPRPRVPIAAHRTIPHMKRPPIRRRAKRQCEEGNHPPHQRPADHHSGHGPAPDCGPNPGLRILTPDKGLPEQGGHCLWPVWCWTTAGRAGAGCNTPAMPPPRTAVAIRPAITARRRRLRRSAITGSSDPQNVAKAGEDADEHLVRGGRAENAGMSGDKVPDPCRDWTQRSMALPRCRLGFSLLSYDYPMRRGTGRVNPSKEIRGVRIQPSQAPQRTTPRRRGAGRPRGPCRRRQSTRGKPGARGAGAARSQAAGRTSTRRRRSPRRCP